MSFESSAPAAHTPRPSPDRGRALVARCSSPRRRTYLLFHLFDPVLLTTFLGLHHLGHDDRDVVRVETGPHGGVRHQSKEVEGGGSGHRWNVADANHLPGRG